MSTKRTSINTAAAVLWACAFLLAALVIVQAGKLPGNPAYAEMGIVRGDYTLVTTRSGSGTDLAPAEVLYVIDSRGETMLAYEIPDFSQRQIVLRGGAYLPVWFRNARR